MTHSILRMGHFFWYVLLAVSLQYGGEHHGGASLRNKKAGQLLPTLDDKRGIGLITGVRQGQGKPDKIFIHKCVLPEMLKGHFQKCQNNMSGNVEMTGLDMSKGHANKTDRNHTEYSETQSIYQAEQMWMEDGMKEYSVYQHCRKRRYAAPVDVLMDVGILQKQKYEEWRFGKIPYLEAVCHCNLRQLSFLMKQIRCYADKNGLKPSFCYYKRWGTKKRNGQGNKPVYPLRFSKSGKAEIEKAYATHFLDPKRIEEIKTEEKCKNQN